MKKKAIRARIAAARPVSPHRSALSGTPESGDRWRLQRPPLVVTDPASISLPLARRHRRAIALQAVGGGLCLRLERVRERGVLELLEHALALAEAVVDELLHALGLRLV